MQRRYELEPLHKLQSYYVNRGHQNYTAAATLARDLDDSTYAAQRTQEKLQKLNESRRAFNEVYSHYQGLVAEREVQTQKKREQAQYLRRISIESLENSSFSQPQTPQRQATARNQRRWRAVKPIGDDELSAYVQVSPARSQQPELQEDSESD